MASELNTITFSDFTRLAKMLWFKGASSTKSAMMESGMVKVMDIPENTGNTREWSEVDDNEYLSYKEEDDTAARAQIQQGYSKTMTAYRQAENLGISWEMRKHNKYPELVRKLTNGGRKGVNTIDLDLSHIITFGTATSYTDRDGRTVTTTACGDSLQLVRIAEVKLFLIIGEALTQIARVIRGKLSQLKNGLLQPQRTSERAMQFA